jgi:hypothetical protein
MSILYDPVNQQPFVNVPRSYVYSEGVNFDQPLTVAQGAERFVSLLSDNAALYTLSGFEKVDAATIRFKKRGFYAVYINVQCSLTKDLAANPPQNNQLRFEIQKFVNGAGQAVREGGNICYGTTAGNTASLPINTSVQAEVNDTLKLYVTNAGNAAINGDVRYAQVEISEI